MRTISVKEAASALGVTPRAVIYRIEKGELKGVQTPNPYGVKEWRIYPTKEIAQKLRLGNNSQPAEEISFEPGSVDAIDAEAISEPSPEGARAESAAREWLDPERERLRILAEEMVKPMLETIRQQERMLQEQSRQLKLLPDLQKYAEEERKAAELKALEVEALNKQIGALQEQLSDNGSLESKEELAQQKFAADAELNRVKAELEEERRAKVDELARLERQLGEFEQYKQAAQEARKKLEELERLAQERSASEEEKATAFEELKRVQEEKDAQVAQMQAQLTELSQRLEKSSTSTSWWRKFFLGTNA